MFRLFGINLKPPNLSNTNMSFKFVDDLTSDVMFIANAKTLNKLFESAAMALMSVMFDLKKIKEKKKVIIKAEGNNEEELLYNFLTNLLITFETKQLMMSKFIVKIENSKLEAECFGEETKQELVETQVKGVTYYNFELKKEKNGWACRVVLDI